MNSLGEVDGVEVLGRGQARSDEQGSRPGRPSFYADPVSWLVADAIGQAAEQAGTRDLATPAQRDTVAVITMSEHCTLDTIRTLAAEVQAGRVSPLRFAGANPGVVSALPGLLLGFRGPSLTLSMSPSDALSVALIVARSWLEDGHADRAAIAAHTVEAGVHVVTAAVVRAPRSTA
ncbi:beta-ketoacyl synthase N-terminal-like domain-containing protein [Dactylosporangium sp. NPDC051485]|uniref:beta-ketoacyl synthase N-terminal-like domain-containing protein n=1 Tax=Dactylosporangium sp. NPDC051485 TaxID=3154846 RepID=UPI00342029CD